MKHYFSQWSLGQTETETGPTMMTHSSVSSWSTSTLVKPRSNSLIESQGNIQSIPTAITEEKLRKSCSHIQLCHVENPEHSQTETEPP